MPAAVLRLESQTRCCKIQWGAGCEGCESCARFSANSFCLEAREIASDLGVGFYKCDLQRACSLPAK